MDATVRELRKRAREQGHTLAPGRTWSEGDATVEYLSWCKSCQAVLNYFGGCYCHGIAAGGGALLDKCH